MVAQKRREERDWYDVHRDRKEIKTIKTIKPEIVSDHII